MIKVTWEGELARLRKENAALKKTLREIAVVSDVFGDSPDSWLYIEYLNQINRLAEEAL